MAASLNIFELDETLYAVLFGIDEFRTLDAFACVSRRFAEMVRANRPALYAAHTKITWEETASAGSFVKRRVYGLLHSVNDQPAILWGPEIGNVQADYFVRGDPGLPDEAYANHTRFWCYRNLRHRGNDQPAVMRSTDEKTWYHRGRQHRDGDRPAVTSTNGAPDRWYRHGVPYKPRQ